MLAPNTLVQGRYQIVSLLRQGGMGAVYEAIDQRLKARVALKQLILDTEDIRIKQAFEREAQILAGLHHPALPAVHDHFVEGDAHFLVMQFIPGFDLAEQLQQRGVPFLVDDVLSWADTLLDALEYLHARETPVIHRDIKPGNLKLSPRGGIMLLDFGLAKGAPEVQSHLTGGVSTILNGHTPHYAPPEQVQGRSTSARSDLYALGATLYDLLTNTQPVDAGVRTHASVNRQPDPLQPVHERNPKVPLTISAAVHHALELRADDRPGSAAEMRTELQAASQMSVTRSVPVAAPTISDHRAPVPWLRWTAIRVALTAAVATVAVAIAIIIFRSLWPPLSWPSTFDGPDTEGWTLQPPDGGSLRNLDYSLVANLRNDSQTSYYVAPPRYRGDWSGYSALEFKLKSSGGAYFWEGFGFHGDIYLANGSIIAKCQLVDPSTGQRHRPTEKGETFLIPLSDASMSDNPCSWTFEGDGAKSLNDVLVNVTGFQIRAEYGGGREADSSVLDDVKLIKAQYQR